MINKSLAALLLIFSFFVSKAYSSENNIYKKIDLFGEVLEKINKEYVDEVNQSESMDSAINGLLQSLDPYSAYMSPEIFNEMQTETSGEFGGLGIEVGMESGVVKVISPIDDTPASKAGIKAGDYIVKINNTQVQGKSLSEAVDLMRGPVGSGIELTIRRRGEKKALIFNVIREVIQIKSVKADLLEKNIGLIHWDELSKNPNAIHILEQHFDKIHWTELSSNPNAIALLEKNPDKIVWNHFSENPAIFEIDFESLTSRFTNPYSSSSFNRLETVVPEESTLDFSLVNLSEPLASCSIRRMCKDFDFVKISRSSSTLA